MCVLGVALTHPCMQSPQTITSVTFTSHTSSLLHAEVKGRKKTGACVVGELDPVAIVSTSGGHSFRIYACVPGAVVEVNRRLIDDPGLLADPSGAGHVRLLKPKGSRRYPATTRGVGEACSAFRAPDELLVPDLQGQGSKRSMQTEVVPQSRKQAKKTCWAYGKGMCKDSRCRFLHETAAEQIAARAARKADAARTTVNNSTASGSAADISAVSDVGVAHEVAPPCASCAGASVQTTCGPAVSDISGWAESLNLAASPPKSQASAAAAAANPIAPGTVDMAAALPIAARDPATTVVVSSSAAEYVRSRIEPSQAESAESENKRHEET